MKPYRGKYPDRIREVAWRGYARVVTNAGAVYRVSAESTGGVYPKLGAEISAYSAEPLLECGHFSNQDGGNPLQAHATDSTGKRFCYACAARLERDAMERRGRTILYLTEKLVDGVTVRDVTNWTGHLSFRVRDFKKGKHNLAGVRYDVWFRVPNEYGAVYSTWHGVTYGDMTQLCHCKRTKS